MSEGGRVRLRLGSIAAALVALGLALPAAASADLSLVTQWGSPGTGNGQFQVPNGVAADAAGNVYVVDQNGDRVEKFDANGAFLLAFGGPGTFNGPGHIGIDPQGNPLVVDEGNYRVVKYSPTGTQLTQYGAFGQNPGQFRSNPKGAAADSAGNVYAIDSGAGGKVNVYAADGSFVRAFGSAGTGPGQWTSPRGIAVDVAGDVYVGDQGNHQIDVFHPDGTFVRSFGDQSGPGLLSAPNELDIDSQGNVWIGDANLGVYEYGPAGNSLYSRRDTGSDSDRFALLGIAVGPGDDVFVTDRGKGRVLRFRQTAPPPVLGQTAAPTSATGTVLVKAPGSGKFKPLDIRASVRIGSTIDTSRGAVGLSFASDASGTTQAGTFSKGQFTIIQSKVKKNHGLTELRLAGGGNFRRSCKVKAGHAARKRPSRSLFSSVHGRFRTRGRNSTATVRGTRWLTKDTCAGTLTRVMQGTVVVQDLVKHRKVTVKRGHQYLARSR
ncbi:MAG: tripartite motif-containing protein 71 [Solirubrobacteraceae bacterium]|nr:tripartite motif-containing protein 71 [Solirubrobacteraceae bacterium]